jgi:hypothetical protein
MIRDEIFYIKLIAVVTVVGTAIITGIALL